VSSFLFLLADLSLAKGSFIAEMALGDGGGQESSQLRDGVLSCGFGSGLSGPVQSSPVVPGAW